MRAAVVLIGSVALSASVYASVASAAPATATLDDEQPALKEESEGHFTVELGFTNLTDEDVTLTSKASDDAGGSKCKLPLDKPTLPAARHSTVTVTVRRGCNVDEQKGIAFTVTAEGTSVPFEVDSAPKPAKQPNWGNLWVFPLALVALVVVAAVSWLFGVKGELKYLEPTWSFKDSWASNVTLGGAVLTGIFGSSDVVKALLGEEVDGSIALATVGSAAAAAFVGAGPLLLLATKTTGGAVTAGGLLFASAVTLTGAYGELWTVYASGHALDLDAWQNEPLLIAAIAGALLLGVYALKALIETVKRGDTKPKTPESDTIRAAKMIVAALKAQQEDVAPDQIPAEVQAIESRYVDTEAIAAEGDYPKRRSAVL